MDSTVEALFTPLALGPHEMKNRIVMAPLTRNRAATGNVPRPLNAEYYRQRATAGLIITEASQISQQGMGYPATPGIHSNEQISGWQAVTGAVHDAGGLIFLQLWHVGRISHPTFQPGGALPVAPSALKPPGEAFTYDGPQPFETPRALRAEEIPAIVSQYRVAAMNALAAGFDGIEVHGANGYLLDQFLRDGSNHRADEWGGSVENRARLLLEVTSAVSGVWGADRVGVRLSPLNAFNGMSDSDPGRTFLYAAGALGELGLAYLHVVEHNMDPTVDSGQQVDYEAMKRAFGGLYMANGAYDRQRAATAVEKGSADMVSFGIPFIANPDLPARLRADAALAQSDPETWYGGDAHGYTDYPSMAAAGAVA